MANPLHQIPREKQRTLAWGLQSFKTDWTPEKKFGVMMLSRQIMALTKKGGHFVGADLRVRPSEEGAHTGAPLRHFPAAIAVTLGFDTPQLAAGLFNQIAPTSKTIFG